MLISVLAIAFCFLVLCTCAFAEVNGEVPDGQSEAPESATEEVYEPLSTDTETGDGAQTISDEIPGTEEAGTDETVVEESVNASGTEEPGTEDEKESTGIEEENSYEEANGTPAAQDVSGSSGETEKTGGCFCVSFDGRSVIWGGEENDFEQIVRDLGYEGEIESVVSSDESAISVYKDEDGVWKVFPGKPFDDETLTAVIGGVEYVIYAHDDAGPGLEEANRLIDYAQSGGTFELSCSIAGTDYTSALLARQYSGYDLIIEKDLVIDLKNNCIDLAGHHLVVAANTKLTVKDSSNEQGGKISSDISAQTTSSDLCTILLNYGMSEEAELTLESGTIELSGGASGKTGSAVRVGNSGTVTVSGGAIKSTFTGGESVGIEFCGNTVSTLSMTGGLISAVGKGATAAYGIKGTDTGTVSIKASAVSASSEAGNARGISLESSSNTDITLCIDADGNVRSSVIASSGVSSAEVYSIYTNSGKNNKTEICAADITGDVRIYASGTVYGLIQSSNVTGSAEAGNSGKLTISGSAVSKNVVSSGSGLCDIVLEFNNGWTNVGGYVSAVGDINADSTEIAGYVYSGDKGSISLKNVHVGSENNTTYVKGKSVLIDSQTYIYGNVESTIGTVSAFVEGGNGAIYGSVTAEGNANVRGTVTKNVTSNNGTVTIIGSATVGTYNPVSPTYVSGKAVIISGTGENPVKVDSSVYASDGSVTVTNGTVNGYVLADKGDVSVKDSTVNGDVRSDGGNATVENSKVNGDVWSDKYSVSVSGGTVSGDVTANNGSVTVTNSTLGNENAGDTVSGKKVTFKDDGTNKSNVYADVSSEGLTIEGGKFYGTVTGTKSAGISGGQFYTDDHPDSALLAKGKVFSQFTDEGGRKYWKAVAVDPAPEKEEHYAPVPAYVAEDSVCEYSGSGRLSIELNYTGNGEKASQDTASGIGIKAEGKDVSQYCKVKVLENGNVVIEFSEEYLKTLKPGTYDIEIIINGITYHITAVIT